MFKPNIDRKLHLFNTIFIEESPKINKTVYLLLVTTSIKYLKWRSQNTQHLKEHIVCVLSFKLQMRQSNFCCILRLIHSYQQSRVVVIVCATKFENSK